MVTGDFEVRAMDGKGGWHYVVLPSVGVTSDHPFGWIIVKGTIDSYPIVQFKLWPTKEGNLFLPIKAEIRKKIRKQKGDVVHVEIFLDDTPVQIPVEFEACLEEVPVAKHYFASMSSTSQKQYIDHIYSAKSVQTRANRIAAALDKLQLNKKWHEK